MFYTFLLTCSEKSDTSLLPCESEEVGDQLSRSTDIMTAVEESFSGEERWIFWCCFGDEYLGYYLY